MSLKLNSLALYEWVDKETLDTLDNTSGGDVIQWVKFFSGLCIKRQAEFLGISPVTLYSYQSKPMPRAYKISLLSLITPSHLKTLSDKATKIMGVAK